METNFSTMVIARSENIIVLLAGHGQRRSSSNVSVNSKVQQIVAIVMFAKLLLFFFLKSSHILTSLPGREIS